MTEGEVYPCIGCMLDTEQKARSLNSGHTSKDSADLWYSTYSSEQKLLEEVLRRYSPSSVLDIGAGTGRIIASVLDMLPSSYIAGVESHPEMYEFVSRRFSENRNVQIIHQNIISYLQSHQTETFDMALCMMATYGNINDPRLLSLISRHAKTFVFSVYNSSFDHMRRDMYLSRGHKEVTYDKTSDTYYFNDCWVKGLKSRSYTEKGIKDIIENNGFEILEFRTAEILYLVVAKSLQF